VTYLDFDLPEATALASYYLMRSLPSLSIQLYGEVELSAEALSTPGCIMMPSFGTLKMPSKSAAVSFNSYSLAEMSPATIDVYIDQITRITSGYFLHVNHNRHAVLSADEFRVEERGFKLVSRDLTDGRRESTAHRMNTNISIRRRNAVVVFDSKYGGKVAASDSQSQRHSRR
jgi:hypothetical protein